MKISARIENSLGSHSVTLLTDGHEQVLAIPPRHEGFGSRVNGGELLFLALATCYCNDLYREALKQNIKLESVHVEVTGEFGAEGQGASEIKYTASVEGSASAEELVALMHHTDSIAEIHNTLRRSAPVTLVGCTAKSIQ